MTPYWIEGGGHNNLELLGRREFYENVARFLKFVRSRGGEAVLGGAGEAVAGAAPTSSSSHHHHHHHRQDSLSSAALRSYKSNAAVGAA